MAISLHFATSRLLFISAHLAAHANQLEERQANVKKIKAEMEVDDFREPLAARGTGGKQGKREDEDLTEDLTDRFDATFVMGDLKLVCIPYSNLLRTTIQALITSV